MRFGILTLSQSENYGTVLQAAATVEAFRAVLPGHEVVIVPTDVPRVRRRRALGVYRWRSGLRDVRIRRHNFHAMRDFVQPYLDPVPVIDASDLPTAARKLRDRGFDGYIVGSDEIWNLANIGVPSLYYAPSLLHGPRVSFATSANRLRFSAVTATQREWLAAALRAFRGLSVRDGQTERFVRSLVGDTPAVTQVLDPTLIEGSRWVAPRTPGSRDGMLVMLRNESLARMVIDRFGRRLDVDSTFVAHAGTRFLELSPTDFARRFGRYRLVVTDFFHGTCMSILNRTPFLSIDTEPVYAQYESKIADLLSKLGLHDRYLNLTSAPAHEVEAAVIARIEAGIEQDEALTIPHLDRWRDRSRAELEELASVLGPQ